MPTRPLRFRAFDTVTLWIRAPASVCGGRLPSRSWPPMQPQPMHSPQPPVYSARKRAWASSKHSRLPQPGSSGGRARMSQREPASTGPADDRHATGTQWVSASTRESFPPSTIAAPSGYSALHGFPQMAHLAPITRSLETRSLLCSGLVACRLPAGGDRLLRHDNAPTRS